MNIVRKAKVLLNRLRGEVKIDGIRIPIDRSIMSEGLELLLARGDFERAEAVAAKKLIERGDVVLEIGACIGFISSYIRKNTPAGRIICVEANPALLPFIARVHARNRASDIVVLNAVLQPSPQAASVPFYCRREIPTSSLSPEGPGAPERIVDVPTRALNEVLQTYRPNTLIVDIEGGEIDLFKVATLGDVRKVVLEVHPAVYSTDGTRAVVDDLTRLGFRYVQNASSRQVMAFVRV